MKISKIRKKTKVIALIIICIFLISGVGFSLWVFFGNNLSKNIPNEYRDYQVVYRIKGTFLNFNSFNSYPQTLLLNNTKNNKGEIHVGINVSDEYLVNLTIADFEYTPEIAKYLNPSNKIQANHQNITNLANLIIENETDVLSIAKMVANWTNSNLSFDEELAKQISKGESNTQDALTTLNRRKGTCSEFSNLFIALMRNIGIPARYIRGKMFEYSYHAWAEIYLYNIGWIPIDPQGYSLNYKWIGYNITSTRYIKLYAGLDFVDIGIKLNELDFRFSLLWESN